MRSADRDDLLIRLARANILYEVSSDGSTVYIRVTGERWEVEFFPDAPLEVEVFRSTGDVQGREALERLIDRFADDKNS